MIDDIVKEFYEETVEKGKELINTRPISRSLKRHYPKSPNDVTLVLNLINCIGFFNSVIFPNKDINIRFASRKPEEPIISYYSPHTNPIRGDSYLINVSKISEKIKKAREKTLIPLFEENGGETSTDWQDIYYPSTEAIIIMSAINATRHRVQHIIKTNIFNSKGHYEDHRINSYVKYLNIVSDSNRFLLLYPESKRPLEFDAKLIEFLAINQIANYTTRSEICNIIKFEGDVPFRWYMEMSGIALK